MKEMTCNFIRRTVENHLDITDLATKERTRKTTDSRRIYYKLCYLFADNYSSDRAGKAVDRDHATVLFHLKAFDDLKNDSSFQYYADAYDSIAYDLKAKRKAVKIRSKRRYINRSLTNRINA